MILNKIAGFANKWLVDITEILKNVLAFAIVCGLLFNDPFGTIGVLSELTSSLGDRGIAAFISLAILMMWYRK
tara:strand:+ start:83 stop:301 length:219 start_codon:yes stop_codon:yes gene_type:complete